MAETRTISTPDGDFSAYVARPAGAGPAPAVVVIQEIFGVNRFVRRTADELAAQGYLAVAPDLFWRQEPGVDITDQTEGEWAKAFELMNGFDIDKGVQDVQATISAVRADPACTGKVGAVGYCLGGRIAYLTAARTDVDATVSYYPVALAPILGEATSIAQPYMIHIAEEDGFVPKDQQAAVIAALKDKPNVTIHTYPGRDHAFARHQGKHYHEADAMLANQRTRDFFTRGLGA
jgi:carboxymethylenebutenolidase